MWYVFTNYQCLNREIPLRKCSIKNAKCHKLYKLKVHSEGAIFSSSQTLLYTTTSSVRSFTSQIPLSDHELSGQYN